MYDVKKYHSRERKSYDKLFPDLSDSAVFRHEPSGGILFYAPLSLEEPLGLQEAFIVSLCDGCNSISAIKDQLKIKFGLTQEEADSKTYEILGKAINTGAIELMEVPKEERKRKFGDTLLQKSFPLSPPRNVIWYVTKKCNLHCQHCFLEGGTKALRELSEKEAKKLIDELGNLRILYLSMSGGEPFLREDLFELIDHAASYGMRVDIASNGTLIDKETVRRLVRSRVFQVQVSIDGSEQVHNLFRENCRAHKASVKAVRRMLDEGIMVSISHTVRKGLVSEAEKVIDWAVAMQCAGVKIIPFYPVGRGKKIAAQYVLTKEDISQLYAMIEEKRKAVPLGFQIYTEMGYMKAPAGSNNKGNFMYCPAGKETLAVYPDGTLYPCPFLTGFAVGKWPEDSLENVWFHSPDLALLRRFNAEEVDGKCGQCLYKTLCGGGCRAFAHYFGSAIDSFDPYCMASEEKEIDAQDNFSV